MLMRRSPHLDFLRLGAILVELPHNIMKRARPAMYHMDLHAAAWTNTFISSVQRPVSTESCTGEITRADEARLMFLAQNEFHQMPPLIPFTPFGSIALLDCTLDVRLHASCAGHRGLRYADTSSDCNDDTIIFQKGSTSSWIGTET